MQTPSPPDWPMWISPARSDIAYIGLDEEPASRTRRHTKAERQAFGAMITIPAPRAILAARTPAGTPGTVAPELFHGAATATRTARTARKTLGWMMAASAAAQEAEATTFAATKATRQGGKAASHVVVADAHVDTTTHYQTADGRIHLLPPGCGPVRPLRGRPHRPRRPRATDAAVRAAGEAARAAAATAAAVATTAPAKDVTVPAKKARSAHGSAAATQVKDDATRAAAATAVAAAKAKEAPTPSNI